MSSFALNFQSLWELDTTPNGATRTWVRLGAGISSADPSNNDNLDQTNYLDGGGFGTTTVIGKQKTIAFSGHRVVGDSAQDYIASVQDELGDSLLSNVRYTAADGSMFTGPVTIANVDFGGGDAGAKEEIAFELHINGKPTNTPKAAATALTATVAGGSVKGTTKFTATAGSGNTMAYKLTAASIGTVYGGSYPSGLIAYTSASDIVATLGQVLNMYELSPYGRVVKFASETLAGSDVTT